MSEPVHAQRALNAHTMQCVPGGKVRLIDVCGPGDGEPGFQLGIRRLAKLVRGKDIQIEWRTEEGGNAVADVYVGGVRVNEKMRAWGYRCK